MLRLTVELYLTNCYYQQNGMSSIKKKNNIGRGVQIIKLSLRSFLHPPVTSSLLEPNILLSTLFSNTHSLRSSLNVSDQVSHPYKQQAKL